MNKKELTRMLKPTRKQLHNQDQERLYRKRLGEEEDWNEPPNSLSSQI